MQIEYITGDIIDGDETVIIHGCNAQGVMGSGMAQAIRDRLTFAYRVYRETYLSRGLRLGDVVWGINVGGPLKRTRIVGNGITQEFYGNQPRQYVDYDAVRMVMRNVDAFVAISHERISIAAVPRITRVAMPLIGTKRGNGKWSRIKEIIETESRCFTPVVYLLDGVIPTD
jgi:O-acetyl-ADP-ribose deacetylase (regulator of RNase III)